MNPKMVVMSPTVETKSFKKKEVVWQQYHLCMDEAQHQILGGKHFLIFWTRIRKDLVVEKGARSPEKMVPLPMDPPAWRENQVDFSQSRQSFASTGASTSLASASGSHGMARPPQFLENAYQEQKFFPAQAPQCRQHALISDFLDLAHLSHELDQGTNPKG